MLQQLLVLAMMVIMITMLLKNARCVIQPARSAQQDCRILALLVALFTIFSYRKLPAIPHALTSTTTSKSTLLVRSALWIARYAWTQVTAVNARLVHSYISRPVFLPALMVLILWLLRLVVYVMIAQLDARHARIRPNAILALIITTLVVLWDFASVVIQFVWHALDLAKTSAFHARLLFSCQVAHALFYHVVLATMSIPRKGARTVHNCLLDRSIAISLIVSAVDLGLSLWIVNVSLAIVLLAILCWMGSVKRYAEMVY